MFTCISSILFSCLIEALGKETTSLFFSSFYSCPIHPLNFYTDSILNQYILSHLTRDSNLDSKFV